MLRQAQHEGLTLSLSKGDDRLCGSRPPSLESQAEARASPFSCATKSLKNAAMASAPEVLS